MARHDIRGLKLSDGTYVFSSKDVYNLNDNFIQLSQEVFGNSNFTKKIEKQVLKNVKDIEEITYRVSDTEGNINDLELTATSLINRISDTEGNVSTLQNTATGLTNRISNAEGDIFALETTAQGLALDVAAADGRALSAQATADAVTLSFKNTGSMNFIENGNLNNGIVGYSSYNSSDSSYHLSLQNNAWTGYENAIEMLKEVSGGNYIVVTTIEGLTQGDTYTVGCMVAVHRGSAQLTIMDQYDTTLLGHSNIINNKSGGVNIDDWGILEATFTATGKTARLRFNLLSSDVNTYNWYKKIRCNKGSVLLPYSQHPDEIYAVSHKLTRHGYEMKDSKGDMLLTPNGVANEQNIGRVDNVEEGYPMKIPFHIGSEVSQITQAVLKWDMSQFRTYSKGAASGGGTKTTPSGGGSTSGSGGSTTVSVRDWTQGLAASTSNATITSSNLGQPHYHTVSTSNLGHRHDIPSHTHTTPSHSHSLDIEHEHAPVFGILETGITVDYIIGITIDGVWRAQVNATRGEIDLSAWITTNGWHELILSVNGIKRLDANLFLKTYIRR